MTKIIAGYLLSWIICESKRKRLDEGQNSGTGR
jgi:hypothetical protein